MHKFMYKPSLLEKLMDDYWNQNKNFITSVLVKKELFTKSINESEFNQMQVQNIAGYMGSDNQNKVTWA